MVSVAFTRLFSRISLDFSIGVLCCVFFIDLIIGLISFGVSFSLLQQVLRLFLLKRKRPACTVS